jgi:hypothetical protein
VRPALTRHSGGILALLVTAGLVLAGCSSGPSTATGSPPTSTASSSIAPGTTTPAGIQAQLVARLRSLGAAATSLGATLSRMQAANDGGTSYSQSDVQSATSDLEEQLLLATNQLNAALPTLPPAAVAPAQALATTLGSALKAFDSTNSLNVTSGSGLPAGLPSSLIDAAAGGPLISQYLGDLTPVTTAQQTTVQQLLHALGAGHGAG